MNIVIDDTKKAAEIKNGEVVMPAGTTFIVDKVDADKVVLKTK